MKCPRCVQRVAAGEASCPHCGYSMKTACELYGHGAVVAAQLMDVEGVLEEGVREDLQRQMEAFGQRFPQLFLLMYLGPLPAPVSPRQFAFWLLNHAAVPEVDALLPNERGLLLVVDPAGGAAVLSAGYFLESFIFQEELDAVLHPAGKDLGRAAYPAALAGITFRLTELLQRKARDAAQHPRRFPLAGQTVVAAPEGFPPLVRTGESGALPAEREAPGPLAAGPAPTRRIQATASRAADPLKNAARRLKPRRR